MPRFLRTLRFVMPLIALLAVAALTAALATATVGPSAGRSRDDAASRGFIQPLRFTNPFLLTGSNGDFDFPNGGDLGGADNDPSGFDLGDAVEGQPITRILSARGGYLPHTFTYSPLLGSGIASELNNSPDLGLMPLETNGLIQGKLDGNLGRYLRFNAVLGDFIGSGRVGTFRLFLSNSTKSTSFRFAVDRLPTGALGHSYFTALDVVNKDAALVMEYTSVDGSLLVNGTQGNSKLEEIGLTVGRDGRIFGRPTVAGMISFKVRGLAGTYDNGGNFNAVMPTPLTRDGVDVNGDQTVSLQVEPTYPLVTEMTAQSFSIKGSNKADIQTAESSISYSGVVDTRGFTGPQLAGSVVNFRVAGGVFTGTFDDKGSAVLSDPNQSRTTGKLKLSTSTGRLSVRISGALMSRYLRIGGEVGSSEKRVMIGLEIKGFRTTEGLVTQFRGGNSKFSAAYGIGSRGYSPTGAFQILRVDGNPGLLDGERATKWQVRFLGMPGSTTADGAREAINNLSKVTVLIGDSFSQEVTLEEKNTVRPSNSPRLFKGKRTDAGLRTVLLDPKRFTHFIQTNALSPADTLIPAAIDTKDLTLFPLSITINGQSGETGRIIAPNRDKWTQR